MNKNKTKPQKFTSQEERILHELAHMKLRELKRGCIARGMPFEEVTGKSIPHLSSWFMKNYENGQDETLLVQYDSWVDNKLIELGYKEGDVLLSPSLKFSVIGNIEEMDKPKEIRPPKVMKEKVKATKDEVTGVRSGTKKALTYGLTMQNKDLAEIIKLVKEKFPDAEEKSIKIWNKKAKKLQQL